MSKEDNGDGKGVLPSAFLLAAVALVMVTGMVLRTDRSRDLPATAGLSSPPLSLPLGSTITPEPGPAAPSAPSALVEQSGHVEQSEPVEPAGHVEPVAADRGQGHEPELSSRALADPLLVKLADRVKSDCGRLAKFRGRWTAQLLVACKPETVDRLLGMAPSSSALYVLPAHVNDDPCFRVCFGAYATSKEAAQAADLPSSLRGKEKIGPVEIVKVLP